VEATKRAGHPGRRPQISADLYLGMLNGTFHGLTENEIIDRLLATRRPEDEPRASGTVAGAAGTTEADAREAGRSADAGRWARDRIATREGIEIRIGLATLAGMDDRPGEIPGLGPVGAHLARTTVAAQRRGSAWRFAVVDTDGHLLLAGPLRRRPRGSTSSAPVRGGVVELHLTVDELRRRLAANPHARFARGPLADHVRIRDRNCCGPGCTRAARRSDLDHTRDHARGGGTVAANIGPACKRHHPDKDRGWSLAQPAPGLFLWVSPLGRPYVTKGEPVRPDLPDPDPAPHPAEETAREIDRRLRRTDPRILERPAPDTPRPPPKPDPPPGEEAPF
jgi:hypothetical protein